MILCYTEQTAATDNNSRVSNINCEIGEGLPLGV